MGLKRVLGKNTRVFYNPILTSTKSHFKRGIHTRINLTVNNSTFRKNIEVAIISLRQLPSPGREVRLKNYQCHQCYT